jgi:alpha-tubulin suppressor-like RCC1 family protein
MTGLTCGSAHACAWNANGELFCWGSDVFAQRASSVDRGSETPRAVDVRFDEPPREE